MTSITIKNIPSQLLARLRERAAIDKRSMNKEIIHLLDQSFAPERVHALESRRMLADMQVQAWSRLGGQWVSDIPIEDEVAGIYAARSGGREIEL